MALLRDISRLALFPKFPPRKSVKTLLVCLNRAVSINRSSMVRLFTLLNYCRLTFELFSAQAWTMLLNRPGRNRNILKTIVAR